MLTKSMITKGVIFHLQFLFNKKHPNKKNNGDNYVIRMDTIIIGKKTNVNQRKRKKEKGTWHTKQSR